MNDFFMQKGEFKLMSNEKINGIHIICPNEIVAKNEKEKFEKIFYSFGFSVRTNLQRHEFIRTKKSI